MFDKTGSTLRAARWIAHRDTAAPHLPNLALNLFSGARYESEDILAEHVKVYAQVLYHPSRHRFALSDQSEQKVLGSNLAVAELQCLAKG